MTLDEYKDSLYPVMYSNLNLLFPNFNFRERGRKQVSKNHLDGHLDRQGKEILNIHSSKPYAVYDLSSQESKGIVDWYMDRNSLAFREALDQIADTCGEKRFQWTEQSDKEKEIQENRQNALLLFVKNLWSERTEARQVLDYLHSRKWTDEDIRKAEIGLITPDLRPQLPDERFYYVKTGDSVVGDTHLLTIPYRTGSRILGFKFREIGIKTANKYLNSTGLKKSEGLIGLNLGVKDIVVVEGELDALHAQVKGIDNISATAGGSISEEQVKNAMRRGVKKFTLLFDNDERGRSFISKSIETIEQNGGAVYISYLPEGDKDTDEYLSHHTPEQWEEVVATATISSAMFRYNELLNEYRKIQAERGLSVKDRDDICNRITTILTSPYIVSNPHLGQEILDLLSTENELGIGIEDYRKFIAGLQDKQREAKRTSEIKEQLSKITTLLNGGGQDNLDEVIRLMRETTDRQEQENNAKTIGSIYFKDSTAIRASMRGKKIGIETNYTLRKDGEDYTILLPSGRVSCIGAPTGHGKTKFLINLALDATLDGKEGTILYIPLEEGEGEVYAQFLNAYANLKLTTQYKKFGNAKTIEEYLSTGATQYINNENRDNFLRKESEFNRLYDSGKIKIARPQDNYLGSILSLIRFALDQDQIKGVFLDYIQKVDLPDYRLKIRSEVLKYAVEQLELTAQRYKIPIVVGAQLNRTTQSPLSMTNQDIADASQIEKTCSEIILLWSNKENVKGEKADKIRKEVEARLPNLNLGTGGKVYVNLTKSRFGQVGSDAILYIDGNTGRIKGNRVEEESSETTSTGQEDEYRTLPF